MSGYLISNVLLIAGVLISLGAQLFVNSSYSKYKKVANERGISGFEVAKKILEKHGLDNIYVTEVRGNLTDHYDSSRKVIRLSTEIFHGTTIASAAVAAHEVGHAIQDKENYGFMRFRETMFPLVKISSYGGYLAIVIGFLLGLFNLVLLGIALELVILVFQLVTLPVEFDASRRAEKELNECGILNSRELKNSKSMLKAAAMTYVAAVLTTALQILRLVMIFSGRRRD